MNNIPRSKELGRKYLPNILKKYEIESDFAADLPVLEDYYLSFIIDDSASMALPAENGITRWQEMAKTFADCLIVAYPYTRGTDLDFLNTGSHLDVYQDHVLTYFNQRGPCQETSTPLCKVLNKVLLRARQRYIKTGVKTLVFIWSDNQPTDGTIDDMNKMLKDLKLRDPRACSVMFLAATNDIKTMEFLDTIDRCSEGLDVCDDFLTERDQTLQACGREITYGDYIVKCLLGAILPKYDHIDETTYSVCVVCGNDIKGPLVKSNNGSKCPDCEDLKATRSPPFCKCHCCGSIDASLVYTKVNKYWYCIRCM